MDQPDGPVTRAELGQEIAGLEGRLTERMGTMQTQIIRVFMEFQELNESRDGSLDKATAGLSERLGMVERRLFEIERKLLLEPPAA